MFSARLPFVFFGRYIAQVTLRPSNRPQAAPGPAAQAPYIGRFAPSPTGPLHFGSLIAALGSYLDARAAGGQWLLRIEDVDTERNVAGAEDEILRALEAFGFEWDGPVWRQTARSDVYADTLERLRAGGLVFTCHCSRNEVRQAAEALQLPRASDGAIVYPGTCRSSQQAARPGCAWRLRVPAAGADGIEFVDAIQGRFAQSLVRDVGDFVLRRADGPFAYQLAVVVDDAAQGVTDIVRGADLLDVTPRQIYLQRCLGLPTPNYLHLPVASNPAGEKLSKQTRATALDAHHASKLLCEALQFLGQPTREVDGASPHEVLVWAIPRWQRVNVPVTRSIVISPQ